MLQKHKNNFHIHRSQSVLDSNYMSETIKKRFNSNFIKFVKKEGTLQKHSTFSEMVERIILEHL